MLNKRTLTAAAAAVIVAASLPSAAAATPLYQHHDTGGVGATPAFQSVTAEAAPDAQQGFQWDDAGLGAAGMLVLVGAGSGTLVAVRRRNARTFAG
jgi:hypothetical protein